MFKRQRYLCQLIYISFDFYYFICIVYELLACGEAFKKQKYQYQFYHHLQKYNNHLMKKQGPSSPIRNAPTALHQAAKYLLRGMVLGVLFEGTFLMFNFQNRITRSVTSTKLAQIKNLQEDTEDRFKRGLKPLVDPWLLREQYLNKVKQLQKQSI